MCYLCMVKRDGAECGSMSGRERFRDNERLDMESKQPDSTLSSQTINNLDSFFEYIL